MYEMKIFLRIVALFNLGSFFLNLVIGMHGHPVNLVAAAVILVMAILSWAVSYEA